MKILLDTHALLWWWENSPRLSATAKEILSDDTRDLFVSSISLWEIATKVGIGKLSPCIPVMEMETTVAAEGLQPLPLHWSHGVRAGSYKQAHRDPFDRMLAAQAELEGLTLLSRDPVFADFPCATLW